jgi:hypothetical protein
MRAAAVEAGRRFCEGAGKDIFGMVHAAGGREGMEKWR